MRISYPPNKIVNFAKSALEHKIPSFRIIPNFTVYWTYTVIVRSFISHFSITKHTQTAYDLYLVFSFHFSVPCVHMPILVDVYSVYTCNISRVLQKLIPHPNVRSIMTPFSKFKNYHVDRIPSRSRSYFSEFISFFIVVDLYVF